MRDNKILEVGLNESAKRDANPNVPYTVDEIVADAPGWDRRRMHCRQSLISPSSAAMPADGNPDHPSSGCTLNVFMTYDSMW